MTNNFKRMIRSTKNVKFAFKIYLPLCSFDVIMTASKWHFHVASNWAFAIQKKQNKRWKIGNSRFGRFETEI